MQPQTFPSFDEYASALGHSSLRLNILGREIRPWAMGSCLVDDVRIRWARDGGPSLFEATMDEKGVALMTVSTPGKVSGNGILLGLSSVMIVPRSAEVRAVSLDTVEWTSVFIPASRLQAPDAGETCPLPVRTTISTYGHGFFGSVLTRVVAAAMNGAFNSNPLGRKEAAQQLTEAARELLWPSLQTGIGAHHTGRHLIPRRRILNRIYETLEGGSDEPLSLDNLAKSAGVSVRTLHNTFIEHTGVSPKRFVRIRLLNTARRDLLRAVPGNARVAEIASELGIWEWGRFARDYRALFGELPSETLRRSG